VVRVAAVEAPRAGVKRRIGFMSGQISVPDDFDRMGAGELQALFEGTK